MIVTDKIAGKEYIQYENVEDLGAEALNKFNLENLLVGVSDNQLRLIQNDGMLATITSGEPQDVYNYFNNLLPFDKKLDDSGITKNSMQFYGLLQSTKSDIGHAYFRLACESCADGSKHDAIYDFIGKIKKSEASEEHYIFDQALPRIEVSFALTNENAIKVYNTVEQFYQQSESGKYKYVPVIHNCVTFPSKVYNTSGFDWTYINYFTDTELMSGENGKDTVFSLVVAQNAYTPAEFVDTDRSKVRAFVKEALGEGFEKQWDTLQHEPINMELASQNPFILSRIDKINEFKQEKVVEFIKDNLLLWDLQITQDALPKFITILMRDNSVDYFELYYYYTFGFAIDLQKIFIDSPYGRYLNDPMPYTLCAVPEYAKFCNEATASLNDAFTRQELISSIDQCHVIDEQMLDDAFEIAESMSLVEDSIMDEQTV